MFVEFVFHPFDFDMLYMCGSSWRFQFLGPAHEQAALSPYFLVDLLVDGVLHQQRQPVCLGHRVVCPDSARQIWQEHPRLKVSISGDLKLWVAAFVDYIRLRVDVIVHGREQRVWSSRGLR